MFVFRPMKNPAVDGGVQGFQADVELVELRS
jgi:hypothetical protein